MAPAMVQTLLQILEELRTDASLTEYLKSRMNIEEAYDALMKDPYVIARRTHQETLSNNKLNKLTVHPFKNISIVKGTRSNFALNNNKDPLSNIGMKNSQTHAVLLQSTVAVLRSCKSNVDKLLKQMAFVEQDYHQHLHNSGTFNTKTAVAFCKQNTNRNLKNAYLCKDDGIVAKALVGKFGQIQITPFKDAQEPLTKILRLRALLHGISFAKKVVNDDALNEMHDTAIIEDILREFANVPTNSNAFKRLRQLGTSADRRSITPYLIASRYLRPNGVNPTLAKNLQTMMLEPLIHRKVQSLLSVVQEMRSDKKEPQNLRMILSRREDTNAPPLLNETSLTGMLRRLHTDDSGYNYPDEVRFPEGKLNNTTRRRRLLMAKVLLRSIDFIFASSVETLRKFMQTGQPAAALLARIEKDVQRAAEKGSEGRVRVVYTPRRNRRFQKPAKEGDVEGDTYLLLNVGRNKEISGATQLSKDLLKTLKPYQMEFLKRQAQMALKAKGKIVTPANNGYVTTTPI